jgi:hypothetical protein
MSGIFVLDFGLIVKDKPVHFFYAVAKSTFII